MTIKSNKFTTGNVVNWYQWLRIKNDFLPALTFYFLSSINATSGRYLPLLNSMQNTRIVLFQGTRFGKFDYFHLKLFRFFIKITHSKQKKYKWILVTDTKLSDYSTNQVLDIDDPLYSHSELVRILDWERKLKNHGAKSVIIVTNETTKKYLAAANITSKIFIIGQGHSPVVTGTISNKFKNFTFVYSSPYIDAAGDKHGNHPTWGVDLFIKIIIPRLIQNDPAISIHLIGHVGKKAHEFLKTYHQVVIHGYKTIEENYKLLLRCDVALYPRILDNNRRVLKIYEYIGANLPIVTFDLEDTKPVKELNIGISVNTIDEFVAAVKHIKNNNEDYLKFRKNLASLQNNYSWESLAATYDNLIINDFN